MEQNEYEDLLDEAEDEFEQSQDISDGQQEAYEGGSTYPQAKQEQSLYNWFWKVVRLNKPFRLAKVGNLNSAEIGQAKTTMRDTLHIANLGHTFHHHKFGNFWATNAKILSATSMAKNGWFMDLSISQRKIRERQKKSSSPEGQKKWRLFQGKQKEEAKKED
jgi:hypothetical protein